MRSDGDDVVTDGDEIGFRLIGDEEDSAEGGEGGLIPGGGGDMVRRPGTLFFRSQTYLVDLNGWKKTLKHGRHQLELRFKSFSR